MLLEANLYTTNHSTLVVVIMEIDTEEETSLYTSENMDIEEQTSLFVSQDYSGSSVTAEVDNSDIKSESSKLSIYSI